MEIYYEQYYDRGWHRFGSFGYFRIDLCGVVFLEHFQTGEVANSTEVFNTVRDSWCWCVLPSGRYHHGIGQVVMIVFPPEYVKLVYPGYFWNTMNLKLYTIKGGTLRPLRLRNPYRPEITGVNEKHYQVSVLGKRRILRLSDLKKIKNRGMIETVDVR